MRTGIGIDDARLTVLLDLRHPEAYLALHPAIAFAQERGLEINWLPLTVPALRRPSLPGPDDDRSILHRRHRANAIAREIDVYGRAQGLVLQDLYRDPDTSAFELGWLWLRDQDVARLTTYLIEAFRAYWSGELDPSSASEVAALLGSLGGDRSAFEAWRAQDGPAAAAAIADELVERGLFGVPGYLVEDEYFMGRQHLPMIGWILDGRSGPDPI